MAEEFSVEIPSRINEKYERPARRAIAVAGVERAVKMGLRRFHGRPGASRHCSSLNIRPLRAKLSHQHPPHASWPAGTQRRTRRLRVILSSCSSSQSLPTLDARPCTSQHVPAGGPLTPAVPDVGPRTAAPWPSSLTGSVEMKDVSEPKAIHRSRAGDRTIRGNWETFVHVEACALIGRLGRATSPCENKAVGLVTAP